MKTINRPKVGTANIPYMDLMGHGWFIFLMHVGIYLKISWVVWDRKGNPSVNDHMAMGNPTFLP